MAALYMSQRHHKEKETLMTSKEDIRDNVIHYDDEGGGEADTHAFDMGTLRNTHQTTRHSRVRSTSKKERKGYGDGILLHLNRSCDNIRSPDIHRKTASIIASVTTKTPLASHGRLTEGDAEVIKDFIEQQLEGSQQDYAPPYDSLATYAYEGGGSAAGSLSSIEESLVIDDSGDFSSLGDWGLHFKTLASILDRQPPSLSEES